MKNENFSKRLTDYEVNKIRAEPEKYLWDALDRYFGVLDITPGAVYKMPELLTLRIWAADDVEGTADACDLIAINDVTYKTAISSITDDGTLEAKNKVARKKVALVLKAMKKSKVGKINLELKNKKVDGFVDEDTT